MQPSVVNYTGTKLSTESIIQIVCSYYQIPLELFHSRTRKREIVQARQISMYFTKPMTGKTLEDIGQMIGDKNHATVLHAIKTVKNLYDTNRMFRQDVDAIAGAIEKEIQRINDLFTKEVRNEKKLPVSYVVMETCGRQIA